MQNQENLSRQCSQKRSTLNNRMQELSRKAIQV